MKSNAGVVNGERRDSFDAIERERVRTESWKECVSGNARGGMKACRVRVYAASFRARFNFAN